MELEIRFLSYFHSYLLNFHSKQNIVSHQTTKLDNLDYEYILGFDLSVVIDRAPVIKKLNQLIDKIRVSETFGPVYTIEIMKLTSVCDENLAYRRKLIHTRSVPMPKRYAHSL